jgi:hypothetical protein
MGVAEKEKAYAEAFAGLGLDFARSFACGYGGAKARANAKRNRDPMLARDFCGIGTQAR